MHQSHTHEKRYKLARSLAILYVHKWCKIYMQYLQHDRYMKRNAFFFVHISVFLSFTFFSLSLSLSVPLSISLLSSVLGFFVAWLLCGYVLLNELVVSVWCAVLSCQLTCLKSKHDGYLNALHQHRKLQKSNSVTRAAMVVFGWGEPHAASPGITGMCMTTNDKRQKDIYIHTYIQSSHTHYSHLNEVYKQKYNVEI